MSEKISTEKISWKKTTYRTIVVFIGNAIGLYLANFLGVGFSINSFGAALVLALLLGIVNTIFWPLLTRILMPFLVLTFGVGSLVLNGLILVLLQGTVDYQIGGWGLILVPLIMAVITTVLSFILTADDESTYYRAVLRDAEKHRKGDVKDYPGVIIVEIDGLAKNVLCEAIEKGDMPNTKKLIEDKSHILREWETDLSSQTGASQAGILHGNNEGITAFRWIEKSNGNQMMQCSGPENVIKIEKRITNGNGLLVDNGASRSNLFSGDTDNVIFTLSKIVDVQKLYNKAWFSVFSNPSNFARIIVLFFWEMLLEISSQITHSIRNIRPRIKRGIVYIPVRAGTNVFMREINTYTLIGDMMTGDVDIAYSTYLGYDEIAHHSGVRDKDSFYALKGMDKQIGRLVEAEKYAKRDYQLVIQSDHGQTNGATFTQRYGETFEDFVKGLLPHDMHVYAKMSSNEDHNSETFIPFNKQIKGFKKRTNKIRNKEVNEKDELSESEVIILASGNLAMIYLTQWTHRLTYEEITSKFPNLLPGIVDNEYVGFILVRSKEKGDMAIGLEGTYYLDSDEIEGKNPLEGYGKNVVRHLKRNSNFDHTPDILVISFYDPVANEVCAFEELVGSHGGVGGEQSRPFILYPSSWDVSSDDIIGAESIYEILKTNSNNLKK
ncbi:MAG: phage holin family protein [Methanobrevibacter sp.]|nr:phage holin family protein [Methanobrevibacter sp.]